jgi:hypothetical protein
MNPPPAWIAALAEKAAQEPAPSSWITASALPELVVGGQVLAAPEIKGLLAAMTELAGVVLKGNRGLEPSFVPPAWVELFKHDVVEVTRDRFVDMLQERFHAADRPSKDRWVYGAVASLGGDRCAVRIGALVRRMAEDLNRTGANLGLDMLKAIGTDTAIMQLDMLTRKVRRNSVRARALFSMNEIAAKRKLTLDELADRIVPDCGLNEKGSCVFDFGPRQFHLMIGKGLKPMIRDESGALRENLPAPRSSDDPAKAAEATAAWKLLKKMFKDTLKLQSDRLELALVQGRCWPFADFQRFIADHPVMQHLARALVWGEFDASNTLRRSFRIAEDNTLCDEHEHTLADLPHSVRIVHPLNLSDDSRSAWGQICSDYGMLPPFDQLNRSVHLPDSTEVESTSLERFRGRLVHPMSLFSKLTKLGWQMDDAGDGGYVSQHHKLHADGTLAVLRYGPGIPIFAAADAEPQGIEFCAFVHAGDAAPSCHDTIIAMALSQVPAIVFSECVRDLTLLTIHHE